VNTQDAGTTNIQSDDTADDTQTPPSDVSQQEEPSVPPQESVAPEPTPDLESSQLETPIEILTDTLDGTSSSDNATQNAPQEGAEEVAGE